MSELEDQIRYRREKRQALEEAGIEPYPRRWEVNAEPAEIHGRFDDKTAEDLEELAPPTRTAGRIQAIRKHGKLSFLDVTDGAARLQLMVRSNKLSDEAKTVLANLDLGDYVGAEGTVIRTRMGELSVMVSDLAILSKALRPLPEKWHGLSDVEARYRQRYLDLATSVESRKVFEARAGIVRGVRRFLDDHGFLEVETPMMHPMAGGATARPFVTHHNTLDLDLYLRIAPELYLKRLLVGGIHRVYEINRNFRNEGISTHHNPEFTMLEYYWAYADYLRLMDFTEEMITGLAEEVTGGSTVTYQGGEIHFQRPWARLTMREAVTRFGGVSAERLESAEDLEAELKARNIPLPEARDYGHLLMALFEETAEEHLVQPTFILDHPVEVSPFAKLRRDDPRFTERFELYIAGMEIANAFSELNDPDDQASRFRQQLEARESGDEEAHLFDHDYVRALEHGMPPAGGEGVGIDRLAMVLTDCASIRDVILFPLLKPLPARPEAAEGAEEGAEEESGAEIGEAGAADVTEAEEPAAD